MLFILNKKIKRESYFYFSSEMNNQNAHLCNVCFENLASKRALYVLACGHVFCEACLIGIQPLFMTKFCLSCPLCRTFSYAFKIQKNFKCNECKKKLKTAEAYFFCCSHLVCIKCSKYNVCKKCSCYRHKLPIFL